MTIAKEDSFELAPAQIKSAPPELSDDALRGRVGPNLWRWRWHVVDEPDDQRNAGRQLYTWGWYTAAIRTSSRRGRAARHTGWEVVHGERCRSRRDSCRRRFARQRRRRVRALLRGRHRARRSSRSDSHCHLGRSVANIRRCCERCHVSGRGGRSHRSVRRIDDVCVDSAGAGIHSPDPYLTGWSSGRIVIDDDEGNLRPCSAGYKDSVALIGRESDRRVDNRVRGDSLIGARDEGAEVPCFRLDRLVLRSLRVCESIDDGREFDLIDGPHVDSAGVRNGVDPPYSRERGKTGRSDFVRAATSDRDCSNEQCSETSQTHLAILHLKAMKRNHAEPPKSRTVRRSAGSGFVRA